MKPEMIITSAMCSATDKGFELKILLQPNDGQVVRANEKITVTVQEIASGNTYIDIETSIIATDGQQFILDANFQALEFKEGLSYRAKVCCNWDLESEPICCDIFTEIPKIVSIKYHCNDSSITCDFKAKGNWPEDYAGPNSKAIMFSLFQGNETEDYEQWALPMNTCAVAPNPDYRTAHDYETALYNDNVIYDGVVGPFEISGLGITSVKIRQEAKSDNRFAGDYFDGEGMFFGPWSELVPLEIVFLALKIEQIYLNNNNLVIRWDLSSSKEEITQLRMELRINDETITTGASFSEGELSYQLPENTTDDLEIKLRMRYPDGGSDISCSDWSQTYLVIQAIPEISKVSCIKSSDKFAVSASWTATENMPANIKFLIKSDSITIDEAVACSSENEVIFDNLTLLADKNYQIVATYCKNDDTGPLSDEIPIIHTIAEKLTSEFIVDTHESYKLRVIWSATLLTAQGVSYELAYQRIDGSEDNVDDITSPFLVEAASVEGVISLKIRQHTAVSFGPWGDSIAVSQIFNNQYDYDYAGRLLESSSLQIVNTFDYDDQNNIKKSETTLQASHQ
jgi:hypothetical protein